MMNTPVKFELAKLLKEKGFDEPCLKCYLEDGSVQISSGDEGDFDNYNHNQWDNYSAPTIAEVVMWLYEKHDIDVSVWGKLPYIIFPDSEYGEGELQWHFEYRIIQNKDGQKCEVIEPKTWFDRRIEAYEAAIEHTLNNLI